LEGMANPGEPPLSRRDRDHAKGADRHGPKGKRPGEGIRTSPPAEAVPPAERRSLTPARVVCVRNVVSPTVPTGIVEGGPQGLTGGRVGKGGRRKRMPVCDGSDRGSNFAPTRKGAHFRLVLDHENGAEQLSHWGYLDGCLWPIEGPVDALRQPSTNPYREGGRSSVVGCFAAPYQGLSPVRGNLHAGFLGQGWAVRPAPYPTSEQPAARRRHRAGPRARQRNRAPRPRRGASTGPALALAGAVPVDRPHRPDLRHLASPVRRLWCGTASGGVHHRA
jgi:hypothetical protein